MNTLMRHRADVFRPTITQAQAAQEIEGYCLYEACVPCFVQPVDVTQAYFYEQRGQEGVATIYTTSTNIVFHRNDIFEVGGQQLHVQAVKPALFGQLYLEITAYWYPEKARKHLSREAYVFGG